MKKTPPMTRPLDSVLTSRSNVALAQFGEERQHRAERQIALEDETHGRGFGFVDDEFAIFDPIAERHHAADPDPLLLRGGDLVANALASDLALKLGEGEQHVQGQSTHAGRRIEGLRHRNKRDALGVEEFDQFGEVGERPCEAIDLIDDDDVELIHSDGVEQLLQGRTLETAAGEAAIVIMTSNQRPALTGLALDIGFTRFALSVERVEVLFESMIGRHARVDRTAANLVGSPCPSFGSCALHGRLSASARSHMVGLRSDWDRLTRIPKKRGPFQRVPVIAMGDL